MPVNFTIKNSPNPEVMDILYWTGDQVTVDPPKVIFEMQEIFNFIEGKRAIGETEYGHPVILEPERRCDCARCI